MSVIGVSDRGVSEALGFVLVFAIITGTIGVVYATGVGGLQDAQEAEKVNNVERAFDVLADNLEDLHRSGTPSRATEVKLAGGSLRTGESVEIEVEAVEVGNLDNNATFGANFEPIVYEDDGGEMLLYSGGAVLRANDDGAAMLEKPRWINGSERSVIPLISTYGGGGNIGGDGAVLVVARRGTRSLRVFDPGATARVNVTITSPRVAVWKQYFEGRGLEPVDGNVDNSNVTYQFETETLYVSKTGVDVSFNR